MAKISSPMVFKYTPNPEMSDMDNMKHIIEDIVSKTSDGVPYEINLVIPGVEVDAKEQREMIEEATKLAAEMQDSAMVPVSVDVNGNTLYQRQDVVTKE